MTDQGNVNRMLYNFIMKYLFNLYHQNNSCICITCRHYHSRRRNIQAGAREPEGEQREALVNLTEIAEDPNQSSKEPKSSFAQEGKPQSKLQLI
jgi:hypothetical protein